MAKQLIASKLYMPSLRPGVVLRRTLVERLSKYLSAKLILISAPAGFGKTTLLCQWIEHFAQSVTWLSLDDRDNEPAQFLTYIVAAIRKIAPDFGAEAEGLLNTPQLPPMESVLTCLLNDIAALKSNFTLVLDDYHVIQSNQVSDALIFIIEHMPQQMNIVISSREDPPFPLARYRARGELSELRAADLRFTCAEATEFLNRTMGLNLTEDEVAALETRTEGWIAGLQLAAISMRGLEDTAGFIHSFSGSHRFVLDYLVEEVLLRQPESERNFLLQTSILDSLTAPLCNAVTGHSDGQETLEALERANLFLVPLDDQRLWYRYHHLFAEMLRARFIQDQTGRNLILHRRASEWYEHNGMLPDAIHHSLAARDWELAAKMIELAWPIAENGNISQVAWLSWVKLLPEQLFQIRPVLNTCYAYALLGQGELEAAESRFEDAEQCLHAAGSGEAHQKAQLRDMIFEDCAQLEDLPATIFIGRAYIAQTLGNIPDTVRYARKVLELIPEGDHKRRGQASMLLGMMHWVSGELDAASKVFADYTMRLRTAGVIADAISSTVVLAELKLGLGCLREAIETVEKCLCFVNEHVKPIPVAAADLYRALCELYLEQGDLEIAALHLQKSKGLGDKAQMPVWRYRQCISDAKLNIAQGDPERALTLLDEAERHHIRSPLPERCLIPALKARIWAAQGRLAEAMGWVSAAGLPSAEASSYLHEYDQITLAKILVAQHRSNRSANALPSARRLLDILLQAAEKDGRAGSMIEILVLQAISLQAENQTEAALAPLRRALALAEPEGYVRLFAEEGAPMELLLHETYTRGISPEYSWRLLSFFPGSEERRTSAQSNPAHADQLSARELEVLRHIAEGRTNQEIAQKLFLSLNTVKAHTRNIFSKLGAVNRTQAVAMARESGLLPAANTSARRLLPHS